jgi:hypothetical protein
VNFDDRIREIVREELAAQRADEWIPHTEWPTPSGRVACQLARSGEIDARRQGRTWYARRSELDRWIESGATNARPRPPALVAAFDFEAEIVNSGRKRKSA